MASSLRPIVVDGATYRWRFDEQLVILPNGQSSPQLYVDWAWRDWLEPGGAAPGREPALVTPRFVVEAIRFAVAQGWPLAIRGRLRIEFRDDAFTVIPPG